MQSNVLNDLAKAKRRRTEKKFLFVLLCLSWALLLSAASVFGVFRFWRGLFLCLVLFVCVLAVLSPLRLIQ